jgi:RHH-type rel operon transcriptional repressor/antitoxin RelB
MTNALTKPVSIGARIPVELDERLTALAGATGRSKSWHAHQALERYIAEEMDFIVKVQQGLDAAREGRMSDHEDVVAEIDALLVRRDANKVD